VLQSVGHVEGACLVLTAPGLGGHHGEHMKKNTMDFSDFSEKICKTLGGIFLHCFFLQ
jgi:hypothetical protein